MVARLLITTADERTWNKTDKPVVFLGEWCKLYSRKKYWTTLDSETVNYHWNDRKKLQKDYHYLQNIHENLLVELTEQLNRLHDVNHTVRYWRILIGPWLGCFVQMLFDRWTMLRRAIEEHNIDSCAVLLRHDTHIIPRDMDDFITLFVSDDWNEAIYGQLLNDCFRDEIEINSIDIQQSYLREPMKPTWSVRVKNLLSRLISVTNTMTVRENEFFFISSYLPRPIDFKLQICLDQFPKWWRPVKSPCVDVDMEKRNWQWKTTKNTDEFNAIVRQMVPKHIPTVYLEGYKSLLECVQKLPWPRQPKGIFTSNSYSSDDVFKLWSAEKTELGSPLVIGQHGGNFGMAPWSFNEEHQITIADTWLSWGWTDKQRPQIIPVGNIKSFDSNVRYNPNGEALMVEMTIPRYSYHMYAIPVAGQWLSYFHDQCLFINALPEKIQKNIRVRLYNADFGWEQKSRWLDRFPEVKIDSGAHSIRNLIRQSRLYISTYNATTYLESLSWNVPTIIFWNPEHWELREDVRPYFELLKSVGIFHDTPESAAQKMADVWDDVAMWWESEEVQKVRAEFCLHFSRTLEEPVDEMAAVLKKVSNE